MMWERPHSAGIPRIAGEYPVLGGHIGGKLTTLTFVLPSPYSCVCVCVCVCVYSLPSSEILLFHLFTSQVPCPSF